MLPRSRWIFDIYKFYAKIKGYTEIGVVYYPMKTNSNPRVIEAMKHLIALNLNVGFENVGFEVDSIEHIKELVTRYGIPASRILYSNLAKTDKEIAIAIGLDVSGFAIDEVKTFKTIERTYGE